MSSSHARQSFCDDGAQAAVNIYNPDFPPQICVILTQRSTRYESDEPVDNPPRPRLKRGCYHNYTQTSCPEWLAFQLARRFWAFPDIFSDRQLIIELQPSERQCPFSNLQLSGKFQITPPSKSPFHVIQCWLMYVAETALLNSTPTSPIMNSSNVLYKFQELSDSKWRPSVLSQNFTDSVPRVYNFL